MVVSPLPSADEIYSEVRFISKLKLIAAVVKEGGGGGVSPCFFRCS